MKVIDEVELKELSQLENRSLNSKRKQSTVIKNQNITKDILKIANDKNSQRNITNDKQLIKSWSDKIWNILKISLKNEYELAPFRDKRHRSRVDEANRYCFSVIKRISTPNLKENKKFFFI